MFNKIQLAELLKKAKGRRSINEFGRQAGISGSYLSLLIRQMKENPPEASTLKKIADIAHNDVSYAELLDAVGLLPTEIELQDKQNFTVKNDHVRLIHVPVLSHITAECPLLSNKHITSWEPFPDTEFKKNEVFSLIVRDNSMAGARIYEGDKVIVHIQPEVEDGEIAVVNVGDENATLKRVKKLNGHILLLTENPKYEPIVIKSDNVRICGKVIQVIFSPNEN